MIDDVTSTDVAIYQEAPKVVSLTDQYPGALVGVTPAEVLRFVQIASRYTGGETVNADPYVSFRPANGQELKQPVWLWGSLAYKKELVNKESGQVSNIIGVVFRLGDSEGPSEKYLSFSSVAAWNFVKRSLLPLIQVGLIGMGDWNMGLPILIRKKILERGHTYNFEMLEETK